MRWRTNTWDAQADAEELAEIIRKYLKDNKRQLGCRRAYNIARDAVDLVFPKRPPSRPRGIAANPHDFYMRRGP